MLEADLERSTLFDPSMLDEMSFLQRLAIRVARLTAPVQ